MATYGGSIRQGLPRVRGGEPWPPAGAVPTDAGLDEDLIDTVERPDRRAQVADAPAADAPVAPAESGASVTQSTSAAPEAVEPAATAPAPASPALRRGLPRVAGGDPWPPAITASAVPVPAETAPAVAEPAPAVAGPAPAPAAATSVTEVAPAATAPLPAAAPAAGGADLRRGLPRTPGGEPWPPAGHAAPADAAPTPADAAPTPVAPAAVPAAAPMPETAPAPEAPVRPAASVAAATAALVPLAPRRTVTPGRYAFTRPQPREPKLIAGRTRGAWAGLVFLGGGALLALAFLAVTFTQWFISLDFMRDFLQTYPGSYALPESAQPGFPAWVQWQHYFNVFFMVLIIRTGWGVRTERRPSGFWSPRGATKSKISLTLWLHQALDLLWFVNGVVFVVLLFVTGHWVRIVPTSWEVFPNALSAVLQYVSLDWPTEHGWVNYNSLQQLMYFLTVFVAAPLAAVTGIRMSHLWPKKAKALNAVYPVELARALHFPVMLYFVVFIVAHVTLVFATGALRNLNHMYGGEGDVDNWVGFWIFAAGMAVIAAAWFAARPLIIGSIAKLFGTVSMR